MSCPPESTPGISPSAFWSVRPVSEDHHGPRWKYPGQNYPPWHIHPAGLCWSSLGTPSLPWHFHGRWVEHAADECSRCDPPLDGSSSCTWSPAVPASTGWQRNISVAAARKESVLPLWCPTSCCQDADRGRHHYHYHPSYPCQPLPVLLWLLASIPFLSNHPSMIQRYAIVRLHDVFGDDNSRHNPGIFSRCTTVAFEVLVIKPGELFPWNCFWKNTGYSHPVLPQRASWTRKLKAARSSCIVLYYKIQGLWSGNTQFFTFMKTFCQLICRFSA